MSKTTVACVRITKTESWYPWPGLHSPFSPSSQSSDTMNVNKCAFCASPLNEDEKQYCDYCVRMMTQGRTLDEYRELLPVVPECDWYKHIEDKPRSSVPLVQYYEKWYVWDETWSTLFGPFDTKDEGWEVWAKYCELL